MMVEFRYQINNISETEYKIIRHAILLMKELPEFKTDYWQMEIDNILDKIKGKS